MLRRSRRWRFVRTRAAVAVVVCDGQVLLTERAHRMGDRWSGHISLPGGRAEPADGDAVATAMRETHEEVGIGLRRDQVTGRLPSQLTLAHASRRRLMAVDPVCFAIDAKPELVLNHEVVEAFWVPVDALRSGSCDATRRWPVAGVAVSMPAWEWQGHVIWGLTYAMLAPWVRRQG